MYLEEFSIFLRKGAKENYLERKYIYFRVENFQNLREYIPLIPE